MVQPHREHSEELIVDFFFFSIYPRLPLQTEWNFWLLKPLINWHSNTGLSCVQLFGNPWKPTRFLCPWNSPGKYNGVGCHVLLQGIFQMQRLNLGLLYWRQIFFFFFTIWATRENPCIGYNLQTQKDFKYLFCIINILYNITNTFSPNL